ncbi:MAG: xylanase, partial [Burkholderiaceae bacterium]|nr:xylanase [Burkholderiaceae bacterium]
DELLGREINGQLIDQSNLAATLLQLTVEPRHHVFTLHAELEGQKLAPILDQLLTGWSEQGYQCVSMADLYGIVKEQTLPIQPLTWSELPGRSGELVALQA